MTPPSDTIEKMAFGLRIIGRWLVCNWFGHWWNTSNAIRSGEWTIVPCHNCMYTKILSL